MPEKAKTPVPPAAPIEPTATTEQSLAATINQKLESAKTVQTVQKVAQCASEAFVPGGSNFLKGDLKQGSIHAVAAFAGAAIIGPVGWVAAIADSLSVSQTGKHLHQHLGFFTKPAESAPAPQA